MRTLVLTLLLISLLGLVADGAAAAKPTEAQLRAAAAKAGSVNGLCPVTRKLVSPAAGFATYKNERVGFGDPTAVAAFKADPTRYMDRMRLNPPKYWYVSKKPSVVALRKAKASFRCANGGCPLTGRVVLKKGGSANYKGQKICFCCPGCRGKFNRSPEKFMRAMRADPLAFAYDRPGPTNAQMRVARTNAGTVNGRCPVMGGAVTAEGGSTEYGGEKIGFCCAGCADRFRKDPERYMGKIRREPVVYGYAPKTARSR